MDEQNEKKQINVLASIADSISLLTTNYLLLDKSIGK